MCHCLHNLLHNSFFENVKIWVGQMTLNREKRGIALNPKMTTTEAV